ncbi:MAG: hypothetical protein K6V97_03230 [Actinomycetia bacterium]|nr:hypothetical protein [Actinomycetes bacterium]
MSYSVGARYLELLTEGDLAWVARVAQREGEEAASAAWWRTHPDRLEHWVAHPALFRALFAEGGADLERSLSPFLLFLAVVHRTAADLRDASAVQEWVGPRQRVFVFDVEPLRAFLASAERRLFLAELLASYTHVTSGAVRVRTRRGWRRQRVSELDPVQLAALLDVVPEAERVWVFRRLGDLSLFLAGVFPDHVTRYPPLDARGRTRLGRILGLAPDGIPTDDVVRFLEQLGRRCYEAALRLAPVLSAGLGPLAEVAREFAAARRVLNVAVDRYILPQRYRWFPNWSA